jgi:hypothetical protein
MTIYGDNQEPGIVTDLTSSAAVPTSGEAPDDVGIVGQADLANATSPADPTKVYQVNRASKAVEWFGPKESSLLTQGVIDALNEGAYPVYVTVAESASVVDEDQSGIGSTDFSLDNAPIREDPESISVTADGTTQTVNVVYDDVSTYSASAGECYVNPVRGRVQVDSLPDTSLDVDYEHFDYQTGIDVMANEVGDVIDYFTPLSENTTVVDYLNSKVASMEQEYNLAIAVAGADIHLDASSFTQSYDDSRTQVVYSTRFEDNTSALAAYVGFKSKLGLTTTPINKRLNTSKSLAITLTRKERGDLIEASVVPLANESRGVRIVDDPTTVSDSNTDEQNLQYGFNRKVADYIIETTRDNQKPFIGKLNSPTVRNTLEGLVSEQLNQLKESNAVLSYTVNIQKEDAVTAGLEMSVDLVEPLRFIENTVTVADGG